MWLRTKACLSSLMLALSLLVMAMAVIPPAAQAAWSDSATLAGSPAEVFNGETVTFHFTLTIAQVESITSVNITMVTAQFEWGAETLYSGSNNITSFPTTLNYDASTTVPGDLAAGTHEVTLNVTAMGSDEVEPASRLFSYQFTSAGTALAASPSADVTTVNAPGQVNFTANAVGGTGPYSYAWTFGDGTTGSGASPSHTYTSTGTYRAGVTVTDHYGRVASGQTSDITVTPPFQATISASATSGTAPLTVDFTSSTSYGQSPYTYLWRFGDGTTSTEARPAHIYETPGTYDAGLTITDSRGKAAASSNVRVTVTARPDLEVTISASATSGNYPLTVHFTSAVENATGTIGYEWTFGDGTNSSEESPLHLYQAPGIYTVQLIVTDSTGRSAVSQHLEITVTSENGPLVAITQSTGSGAAPLRVQFNSTVTNGTSPYFYHWDFGDGTTASGARPNHLYTQPGTYKVHLTVTDSESRVTMSDELTVTVTTGQSALDEPSWDWTIVVMVGLIVAFLLAGILLVRPRR